MKEIINEDECNDTYGRIRMYQALLLKQPEECISQVTDCIPGYGANRSESSAKNRMDSQRQTEAMKSDDLLKRDFHSNVPLEKCMTDITEIPASMENCMSAIF